MSNQSTPYDERFLWTSGSICSVYSRSHCRWYRATINDISIDCDTKKEWLTVQYNHKRTRKRIQRLCNDIKPIGRNHTVWVIGDNQYSECGQHIDAMKHNGRRLTLCSWSQDVQNVIGIARGLGFNIYTVGTHYDEFLVFGFIKAHLIQEQQHRITLPNHLRLQILSYFGANYSRYFSLGLNDFGQCCCGHNNALSSIHPIISLPNINKICIGSSSRNVLWIQNDGSLYIAGRNLHKSYRELFYEAPMLMEEWTQRSLKCIDAAASHFHCMVVCDDGSVWSLGRGTYGELGHGRHPKLFPELFAKIKTLQRYRITSVSAGNYFSLFLCDDGNVWSCGKNTSAQCGLGYYDDEQNRSPTKIDYFERKQIAIMQIECGESHSIALSTSGRVYCWGNNDYGQCAINRSIAKMITIPTIIQHLSALIVCDIFVGAHHSGCRSRTKHYDYYIWGCNDHNECCCIENEMIFKPHCINSYVYKQTKTKHIVDISLGSCNTVIIVSHH